MLSGSGATFKLVVCVQNVWKSVLVGRAQVEAGRHAKGTSWCEQTLVGVCNTAWIYYTDFNERCDEHRDLCTSWWVLVPRKSVLNLVLEILRSSVRVRHSDLDFTVGVDSGCVDPSRCG